MSIVLYAVGLIIGVSVFFYILWLFQAGKQKISKLGKRDEGVVDKPALVPPAQPIKRSPGDRICPLCFTVLTKHEVLYASQVDGESGPKILIHGCQYCYKPNRPNIFELKASPERKGQPFDQPSRKSPESTGNGSVRKR